MMKLARIHSVGAFSAIVVAALSASTLAAAGSGSSKSAADDGWVWQTAPGVAAVPDDRLARALEMSPGVPSVGVRQLVDARIDTQRYTLAMTRDFDGKACLTVLTDSITTGFSCLSEAAEGEAVIDYAVSGGSQVGTTDWTVLIGVARADVHRIVLTLRDGTEQELRLNSARAFSYSTSTARQLPTRLTAFRNDGSVAQESLVAVG